jgi:iron complex transport system ATP-binding protein
MPKGGRLIVCFFLQFVWQSVVFYLFLQRINNRQERSQTVDTEESIQLNALAIGYRDRKSVKVVARDISAVIRRGELTCLLGANGVGKSTLLRTLSAFQPKLDGRITLRGRELGSYSDSERSRLIGVVLTEKPSVQNMTVSELVALGRSPYTDFWGRLTADDRRIVSESLELVGISALSGRLVDTLSDGERQKVMIAKALAQQTPVIFLDEPTAFLDFPSKVETMLLLRRISREASKTVFLSTHDLELALQTADTVWLMQRDAPIAIGTPRQLADSGVLSRYVERPQVAFDATTLTISIKE